MDIIYFTIIIRFLVVVCLIGMGFYSIKQGLKLYRNGTGLKEDGTLISAEGKRVNIRLSLKTVGSVLMVTALGWGYLAYLSLPSIEQVTDQKKVNLKVTDAEKPSQGGGGGSDEQKEFPIGIYTFD